ncbi:hypothetical protein [Psychromonas sp. KJ10-2]|uniref:hypothetical protein n=1 Tax=Psychromonas sp. KJ10-2 TaxID=3391822 RepID=UPI0039B5EBAC
MNVNTETSTNPINHLSVVNGHTETKQLNWSKSDIQELKYSMLMQSLEELKDNRESKSMKLEAWNWLMIDSQSDNPFSAESCY